MAFRNNPVIIVCREPPVPIPNTVVKAASADDTEWESRYCGVISGRHFLFYTNGYADIVF